MSETPLAYERPSPRLGEHTAEILAELEKPERMKTGGQLIVDALEANGVDRIFCVPGESYLAVLDALHDSPIRTIVCRQEGGAAMMADCHGKLTGKPGICFVTRGPGATNASAGIHIAMQDSTPDDPVHRPGRPPHRASARPSRRSTTGASSATSPNGWSRSTTPARIPEFVTRAFAVATSGRPGPVVIALPEDMLTELAEAPRRPAATRRSRPRPGEAEMRRSWQSCSARPSARSPSSAASRWSAEAVASFQKSAEAWSLPVGCSFRRQMLFDHLHPELCRRCRHRHQPEARRPRSSNADLVLLVGGRFGEMPSSDYTLLKSPYPDQTLVHVHPDAGELGRVYRPTLAINATPDGLRRSLRQAQAGQGAAGWAGETATLHDAYLDWSTPPETGPGAGADGADHELSGNGAARRRHPHQRRRQLRDLGAPLPPLPPLRHAGRADLRLDGLRHAGRGRRQGALPGPRSSSPLPATAAS